MINDWQIDAMAYTVERECWKYWKLMQESPELQSKYEAFKEKTKRTESLADDAVQK